MVPELRKEDILKSIKSREVSYIKDLAAELGISMSTVRRDVAVLEQEGSVSVMRGGAVKYKGEREEVPEEKKAVSNIDYDIIGRKAAALVEDGDCIYIDSGEAAESMFPYLSGKQITIVSGSRALLSYLPIEGARCLILGGEVREGSHSILGVQAEKMISDLHFNKAFIGADGYVPEGSIYTSDDREARKKVLVKDHSDQVYILIDTSRKNKYAFAKVFDLSEGCLITEEE